MADAYTPNLNLTKPEVGASRDTWGAKVNSDMDTLDAVFAAAGTGTSVGLNVGSGKTLAVAGTQNVTGALNVSGTLATTGAVTASGPVTISANSSNDAVRITQTGAGNAFVVEDEANPDATPFVVTADGTVVAGHTSVLPAGLGYAFQAAGNSAVAGYSAARFSANAGAPVIALGKSRNTSLAVGAIVQNADNIGTLDFRGDDGAAFISAAQIAVQVDGTPGVNDMPGRLVFSTTADGAATPTERMRIGSTGNVGINGTSSLYKLYVNGGTTAGVYSSSTTSIGAVGESTSSHGIQGISTGVGGGAGVYGISATGYAVYGKTSSTSFGGVIGWSQNNTNYGILGYSNAWALYGVGSAYISGTYQGSDARLKENVAPLEDGLSLLRQLSIKTFDWREGSDQRSAGRVHDVGVIAQEAMLVMPDLVKEATAPAPQDGQMPSLNQELGIFYTAEYGKLIPYLVRAVQQQADTIEALQARIAVLEGA